MALDPKKADRIIAGALDEDLGERGDITTKAIFSEREYVEAQVTSKSQGIVAGLTVARRAFEIVDPKCAVAAQVDEGAAVRLNQALLKVEGPILAVMAAERVALNFLQHLSGIATLTNKFVAEVTPYGARIFDTRKTTPGLRAFEKYAVTVGGGFNHRVGLFDSILIKDNHIRAAGTIGEAVRLARSNLAPDAIIEIETENLKEVDEALDAGVNIVLLDNMDTRTLRQAVSRVGKRALTEASGGITLRTVAEVARTGVDRISVGAITQAAPPLDISLEIVG